MPNRRAFLTQMLLAHDQVALGDLVLSMDTPWNDFRQYPIRLQETVDFAISPQPVDQVLADISDTAVKVQSDNLLTAALFSGRISVDTLKAEQAQYTSLKNSGDKFEALLNGGEQAIGPSRENLLNNVEAVPASSDSMARNTPGTYGDSYQTISDDIKLWLEKYMVQRGSQAFMIVGFYTLTSAQLSQYNLVNQNVNVKAQFGANFGIGGHRRTMQGGTLAAPGTHIFAIEYRQVCLKYRLFRKREIQDATLSLKRNQWKSFGGDGGQRVGIEKPKEGKDGGNDEEEEFYEAILIENLDPIEIEEIEE